MTFIQRLNKLLKERKLSRAKFLADLHFGKNQYNYWEKTGSIPNLSTLTAIAQYFSISVEYLIGSEDDENYERRIVEEVIEWLEDNGFEYEEHENFEVSISKNGKTNYYTQADFKSQCLRIKKDAEDGFGLAMLLWEKEQFNQEVHVRSHNHLVNAINESPHATLNITGNGLSMQENQLIEIYRGLSLQDQIKLITLAYELHNK